MLPFDIHSTFDFRFSDLSLVMWKQYTTALWTGGPTATYTLIAGWGRSTSIWQVAALL